MFSGKISAERSVSAFSVPCAALVDGCRMYHFTMYIELARQSEKKNKKILATIYLSCSACAPDMHSEILVKNTH